MENVIIPDEVIEVKYPDFEDYPLKKQLDLFTDEMAMNDGAMSTEVLLMKLGVNRDTYKKLIKESNYLKLVHDKGFAMRTAPHIGNAYETLGRNAVDGDAAALKMIMQTGDKLNPESVTLINQNLQHMDAKQLLKEAKQLQLELKELDEDEF